MEAHIKPNIRDKVIFYVNGQIPNYVHDQSDFLIGEDYQFMTWNLPIEKPDLEVVKLIDDSLIVKSCDCQLCFNQSILKRLLLLETEVAKWE